MSSYVQESIPIRSEPLGLAAILVQSMSPRPCFLYERNNEWSVALDAAIEILADRSGVHSSALETGACEQLDMRSSAGTVQTGDPLRQIEQILRSIPWQGWRAYGTVSFELAGILHGLPADDDDHEPFARIVIPKAEVRIRHGEAVVRAIDEKQLADAIKLIESLHLEGLQERWPPGRASDFGVAMPEDSPDASAYKDLVRAATKSISEQKLQKVIVSRVVSVPWPIDMAATYVAGRRMNTPARSFLVRQDGGLEFAGFSPETVVEVDSNGDVSTQPLAGTRALGSDETECEHLRRELLADCKELAEHAVSVKLAFEELEAVCAKGTVSVDDFMHVVERGSVQHLSSRLRGRLGKGNTAWSALSALFPAVTASGVPKREAVEWIRTHESERRRHYSGAVLVADQDGSLDAALVLRTVFQRNHRAWIRVGAGIVSQSTPKRELRETYEKLACVARHLVPENGVLCHE